MATTDPNKVKPSRVETILMAMLGESVEIDEPKSRVEELLLQLKEAIEQGGGSGFTPTQDQLDAMNSGIDVTKVAQIETNENNISLLMENGAQNKIISEKSAYDSTYNGYFDATAGFIENVEYKSFVFEVDKNTTIYTISHNATYFSICVYPNNDLTNGIRYRYKSGKEDTLPYANNPLNLSRGQYVALTVAVKNSQPLEFIANLTNYVSIKQLGDEINLNAAQIAQATTGKANLIKYNSTASGKYTESVDIYTPTITGYIHYNFAHGVDTNINANIWHITKAYYCDDELVDIFKLTYDGEWELALKPLNAPDFAAGMAHGDQIMNGISWFIDGYATDITEIAEITPFAELKVVETSTLYNPITPTDILATTGIEYLWTCEKLTLNQAVNFNLADAMQFEMAYIGMHLPYKSITDHYYVDTNYAPTLCTGNYGTKTNTKDISVYGENTGVFTHFWVDSTPTGYRHSDDISLRDNSGLPYNKCYNIVIEGSTDNTVPAGVTTWKCKCNYSFSVNLQ